MVAQYRMTESYVTYDDTMKICNGDSLTQPIVFLFPVLVKKMNKKRKKVIAMN